MHLSISTGFIPASDKSLLDESQWLAGYLDRVFTSLGHMLHCARHFKSSSEKAFSNHRRNTLSMLVSKTLVREAYLRRELTNWNLSFQCVTPLTSLIEVAAGCHHVPIACPEGIPRRNCKRPGTATCVNKLRLDGEREGMYESGKGGMGQEMTDSIFVCYTHSLTQALENSEKAGVGTFRVVEGITRSWRCDSTAYLDETL